MFPATIHAAGVPGGTLFLVSVVSGVATYATAPAPTPPPQLPHP